MALTLNFKSRNLKIEKMKGLMKIAGVITTALMLTSCIVHDHPGRRGRPLGQVKKVYMYEKRGHGHGHHKHRGHRGRH